MNIPSKEQITNYIEDWYKNYVMQHPIVAKQGTWLHYVAGIFHALAKITALIPNLSKKNKPKQKSLDPALKAQLEAKLDLYKNLMKSHQDQNGFIMSDHCDSLLFSGLMSASQIQVNMKVARDEEGFWHRRPLDLPECWRGVGDDGSTISRDMFSGLFWYLYSNKDLESAEKLYELAKQHHFVMGQGDPARLVLMPGGEATLTEIIHQLGGKNHWFARRQLQTWPKNITGYQIHLLMLHSLLRSKMLGYADGGLLDVYKSYAENNPNNPLHQFAYHLYLDGDMNDVAKLLLNEAWWPNNRLPKAKDRSSDWVTQRDYGQDWLPATGGDLEEEFTGGDFIFVAWLVLQ